MADRGRLAAAGAAGAAGEGGQWPPDPWLADHSAAVYFGHGSGAGCVVFAADRTTPRRATQLSVAPPQ